MKPGDGAKIAFHANNERRRLSTMRRRSTHLVILAALLAAALPALAAEEAPGEEIGPAVGSEAPGFTLEALDGGPVSLADFRGEAPVVLVFFRGEW